MRFGPVQKHNADAKSLSWAPTLDFKDLASCLEAKRNLGALPSEAPQRASFCEAPRMLGAR